MRIKCRRFFSIHRNSLLMLYSLLSYFSNPWQSMEGIHTCRHLMFFLYNVWVKVKWQQLVRSTASSIIPTLTFPCSQGIAVLGSIKANPGLDQQDSAPNPGFSGGTCHCWVSMLHHRQTPSGRYIPSVPMLGDATNSEHGAAGHVSTVSVFLPAYTPGLTGQEPWQS